MGDMNLRALKLEKLEKASLIAPKRVSVDSSRRITLKSTKADKVPMFDDYRIYYLEDGTVILRPLVVTEPENVIKPTTMKTLTKSVENFKKGKVGKAFNLADFQDLLDEKDE